MPIVRAWLLLRCSICGNWEIPPWGITSPRTAAKCRVLEGEQVHFFNALFAKACERSP
jgi:hypothetical protein